MSSFPPELADPVEQLRTRLVEINGSEQTCMTNALQGESFTVARRSWPGVVRPPLLPP
jgi:hypothetical protein